MVLVLWVKDAQVLEVVLRTTEVVPPIIGGVLQLHVAIIRKILDVLIVHRYKVIRLPVAILQVVAVQVPAVILPVVAEVALHVHPVAVVVLREEDKY